MFKKYIVCKYLGTFNGPTPSDDVYCSYVPMGELGEVWWLTALLPGLLYSMPNTKPRGAVMDMSQLFFEIAVAREVGRLAGKSRLPVDRAAASGRDAMCCAKYFSFYIRMKGMTKRTMKKYI